MNKKGYTVIELLAVIVIIGLLFSIAIVAYSSFIERANNTVYESYINSMHEAAQNYVIDNPLKNGDSITISLAELISNNWIDSINNPKDNTDKCLSNSQVTITRNDINNVIKYDYIVCLECTNYTNNCNNEF